MDGGTTMATTIALQIKLPEDLYRMLRQAAAERDQSEAEVAAVAIQTYLQQLQMVDPLLGLFADEPDFVEEVTADIMLSREKTPWRIADVKE